MSSALKCDNRKNGERLEHTLRLLSIFKLEFNGFCIIYRKISHQNLNRNLKILLFSSRDNRENSKVGISPLQSIRLQSIITTSNYRESDSKLQFTQSNQKHFNK